jgi:hypothetical protein
LGHDAIRVRATDTNIAAHAHATGDVAKELGDQRFQDRLDLFLGQFRPH